MSSCTAIPKENFIYFPRELNQIEVGIPASLVDLNWQQCVTPTEMKSGQPDTAISLQQNYAISPPTGIQLSLTISLPIKQFQEERLAAGDRWHTLYRNRDNILEMVQFWIDNRLLSDLFKYHIFQLYFLYRSSGR